MTRAVVIALALGASLVVACTRAKDPVGAKGGASPPAEASAASAGSAAPIADAGVTLDAAQADLPPLAEPDGNREGRETGEGALPDALAFEKIGAPPLALSRICDLTTHQGALYMAHAHVPLGTDGATLTRFDPSDAKRPFRVAFDWNRHGEPAKGGGAGQGFLRIRAIGGRLFVPDADPPYNGLGLVEHGTEGYVFVSGPDGRFAPPRAPHYRPPGSPDAESRPGAGVLPRAYHVIDVAKFKGEIYASPGSVPPTERAWRGASPGALHRASVDLSRWTYAVDYPHPWRDGVWRLTYMTRFRGRLYAGIQDYDARDPNDYVYFTDITQEGAHPTRVTDYGTAQTLRWYADPGPAARAAHLGGRAERLFWIAFDRSGVALRVTEDGDTWRVVPLPPDAGRPTDIVRFRDALVVLTEKKLLRLDPAPSDASGGDAGAAAVTFVARELATYTGKDGKPAKKSPFDLTDYFCAAPLGVLGNTLYAGGQRGGILYKIAPVAPEADAGAEGGAP